MLTSTTPDIPCPENQSRSWRSIVLNSLLWLAALIGATFETAIAARAVKDLHDAENTDAQSASAIGIMTAISLFAFLQSMAFSGRDTVNNFTETIDIIQTKKLPATWPTLSKRRERTAAGLASIITVIAAGLDFFAAYYFIGKTPDDYDFTDQIDEDWWNRFSIFIGACIAFITIFTEGIETYKSLRNMLAGEKTPYAYFVSKYLSRVGGLFLALTGGAEIVIETYGSMQDSKLLSVTNSSTKYSLLSICLSKGIGDISFSGRRSRMAITTFLDKICDCVSERKLPQKTEMAAFLLSASSSVIVAYPQRALTTTLMTDPKTALPFQSPSLVTMILSWGVTWRDGIVQTDTLYEHFLRLIRKLCCVATNTVLISSPFDYAALIPDLVDKPFALPPPNNPITPLIYDEKEPPPDTPDKPLIELTLSTAEAAEKTLKKIYTEKNPHTFHHLHQHKATIFTPPSPPKLLLHTP